MQDAGVKRARVTGPEADRDAPCPREPGGDPLTTGGTGNMDFEEDRSTVVDSVEGSQSEHVNHLDVSQAQVDELEQPRRVYLSVCAGTSASSVLDQTVKNMLTDHGMARADVYEALLSASAEVGGKLCGYYPECKEETNGASQLCHYCKKGTSW